MIDASVDKLYGDCIRSYFDYHGVKCRFHRVDVSEPVKGMPMVERVVVGLDGFGVDRRGEPIIVIGGGVAMDIVGMAASVYRRGTPFIRVPTTLIGQVDAGVGVKTGVNFNGHKNRLGTYFPADLTLVDRSFLRTLDRRHTSNGMAEILKMAIIKDARLFELLERYGEQLLETSLCPQDPHADAVAAEVLSRSIQGMLTELQPNLWEARLERAVDAGHTFSPAFEMHALPELLHGEAVSLDLALTSIIALRRGLLEDQECERIFGLLGQLELPSWHRLVAPGLTWEALQETVRHRGGLQRVPLCQTESAKRASSTTSVRGSCGRLSRNKGIAAMLCRYIDDTPRGTRSRWHHPTS